MSFHPVEIIVPIYNAAAQVSDCLDALHRHVPDWATLQLVDDASTEAAIPALLERHPVMVGSRTCLHRNPHNLGFVATVNQAMARVDGDVLLLNSDTVVSEGWLQRMQQCALSADDIASVTPWSNHAEICSLPLFCQRQEPPSDVDALARAIASVGTPDYPELPTAVGFCMYVRRSAWQAIGDFDAATFGHGYGEENDWCLRAIGHGYRHLLCDDAYVAHVGGASFAATSHRPGGEQLQRLLARYPYYNDRIADFIRVDPLAGRRNRLLADPRVTAALST